MGNPIQPGDLQFITREYFLEGGEDYAYDQTLSFQQLDTTLIYLSNSIANVNPNINTGSLLLTASANLNIITFSKADGTPFTITIDTGSGQTYTAGNGINIDGNNVVSSKILTVNGQGPNESGNISTALTAVITGNSSSLVESSSGTITGSIANGTVWVISGDGDATKNGDSYIFKSGSTGQWYAISPLDEVASDARYVKLSSTSTQAISSSLLISGSTTFSGSLFWSGASNLGGAANNVLVLGSDGQIYKTGSYGTGGSGGPGIPSAPLNSIQFNDNSSFGGSANLTFTGTNTVNLTGSLITSGSTPLRVIGTGSVTGSMIISRSIEGTPLTVIGTGSSPILNIVGSTGNLLQTYDQVSGDIFTVGEYPSGLPILRVTSDKETFIGNSNAPGLYTSFITSSVNAGTYYIYNFSTSSYNTTWIDYFFTSGSNFRAGTFNAAWSGSTITGNDISASSNGPNSTYDDIYFGVGISNGNASISTRIVNGNGWTMKYIIKAI
jgi:hypothetical protein